MCTFNKIIIFILYKRFGSKIWPILQIVDLSIHIYTKLDFFIMSKLRKNRKGSSKRYNMSIIDSPKIGQKRSMRQAKISSSHSNSRPKRAKFDPILNQSLVRQFKEEEKDENLESLMPKLNIQDISPKQHDQNDKAQVVVDCNDAVIEKEREQESHTRIRLTHQEISTKIAGFVNSN